MDWRGEFAFGDVALVFRGESAENRFHSHASVQLVCGPTGTTLVDAGGRSFEGRGWIVRSGTGHRLEPAARIVLVLVEPSSRLARSLLARSGDEPIAPLPPAMADLLDSPLEVAALLRALEASAGDEGREIDPRLAAALAHIDDEGPRDVASAAAAHAGLSPSRLRALSREHFGVPFSKLVLWRKVRHACVAIAAGASLADAAAAAGFADQAHLTRTMTEVIGLTPGQASRSTH